MDKKIIEVSGIKKRYNGGFCLDVDYLYAKKSKILSIIGPNGSGKSTLIRLINILEKPDGGKIYFNGLEITNGSVNQVEVRKKMAVVFQEPLLFNTPVYSNIIIGLKIRKIKLSVAKDRLDYLIVKLKIGSLLNRSVGSLSGGEKQRVSLARALVADPELLLLDEPANGLDPASTGVLRSVLRALKRRERTVVVSSHNLIELERVCDEVLILRHGRLLGQSSREEIARQPEIWIVQLGA